MPFYTRLRDRRVDRDEFQKKLMSTKLVNMTEDQLVREFYTPPQGRNLAKRGRSRSLAKRKLPGKSSFFTVQYVDEPLNELTAREVQRESSKVGLFSLYN